MPGNYTYRYPHPAVTVDTVVFGWDGNMIKVLLVERGGEPYKGCYAVPGGFLNIDEDARHGAQRELQEETGLKLRDLEQLHTFSAPARDPRERVISIAYMALTSVQPVAGGDDAAAAAWYPLTDMPSLAFDHLRMLHIACIRLAETLSFRPIGLDALPKQFYRAEISDLYTAIREICHMPVPPVSWLERPPWIEKVPGSMDADWEYLYRFNESTYRNRLMDYYEVHDDLL